MSPGSNYHISVLLNLFSTRDVDTKLVLPRPSFPLFEGHCRYQNIPYKTWNLNKNFEYKLENLPELSAGSCVFIASPNNPVGNTLPQKDLITLLKNHPDSFFVMDEAYWEFAEENTLPLLAEHSNLLVMRTFSKAMGSAGLRFSYVVTNKAFCAQIKKLTLPFIVNKFTSVALTHALKNQNFMDSIQKNVEFITMQKRKAPPRNNS